jgi:hypothetical protein
MEKRLELLWRAHGGHELEKEFCGFNPVRKWRADFAQLPQPDLDLRSKAASTAGKLVTKLRESSERICVFSFSHHLTFNISKS